MFQFVDFILTQKAESLFWKKYKLLDTNKRYTHVNEFTRFSCGCNCFFNLLLKESLLGTKSHLIRARTRQTRSLRCRFRYGGSGGRRHRILTSNSAKSGEKQNSKTVSITDTTKQNPITCGRTRGNCFATMKRIGSGRKAARHVVLIDGLDHLDYGRNRAIATAATAAIRWMIRTGLS